MSKTIAQHLTDEVPALHFIVFMHGFAVLADEVSCVLKSAANRREMLVIASVLPLLALTAPVTFFSVCPGYCSSLSAASWGLFKTEIKKQDTMKCLARFFSRAALFEPKIPSS